MKIKTSNLFRLVSVATTTSLLMLGLTACAQPVRAVKADGVCHTDLKIKPASNPKKQIAAIIAPTSNFVDFETVLDFAEPLLKKTLGKELPDLQIKNAIGNQLTMIIADGKAQVASSSSVTPIDPDIVDDIRSSLDGAVKKIREVAHCSGVGDGKPVDYDWLKPTPEADIIKALNAAADTFSSDAEVHEIYILGNGIQTTGAIRMQDKGSFPTSEDKAIELANNLYDLNELPVDLYGARVHWIGLGQTDPTKQDVPEPAVKGLKAFWQEVIRLSNGELADEDIESSPGKGEASKWAIPVNKGEAIDIQVCRLFSFGENDGLIFKADSAVFVDLAKAKSKAKTVAKEYVKKHCSMVITGFAAPGTDHQTYLAGKSGIDAKNAALTKKRAQTFAKLVRDSGFKDIKIGTRSGTCTEWRETFKPNGDMDETAQKVCRRVEVTNGK